MKPHTTRLFTCSIAICLSAGTASAALTLTRVAAGDLDPNWDGVNLSTFDGTQAPNAGTTTDWHMFGGTTVTPSDYKSGGSGIGALTFTQGTGGPLASQTSSSSQPDVTWSDGTIVTSPASLVESYIASLSAVAADTTIGETFSISLAASPQETTAYLFLGVLRATGELTATLGGETQTDSYGSNTHGAIIYELVYSSPTETSLDLVWKNIEDRSTTSVGGIRFQAVTMSVVPEPSSTALLGLGGLSLILRRRK